jgi:putative lipoic acid-binding regulatory protein
VPHPTTGIHLVDSTPFEFPLIFPLKAIGRNDGEFEGFVVSVVQTHAPLSAHTVTTRLSQGGNYLAVTVTFVAESREQLEAIYQDLSKSGRVMMAL